MSLNGQISVQALLTLVAQGAQDLSPQQQSVNYIKTWSVVSGLLTYQADQLYQAQRTVAGAANDDLDLAAGALTSFGVALTFAKVKAILIEALASNTTNLTVGNATAAFVGPFGAAAHTFVLAPGDFSAHVAPGAGWVVTPTTADILRIANAAGAAASYRIVIAGTSA
jgi:hypothetical protein